MAGPFQVWCSKAVAEEIHKLFREQPAAVRQQARAALQAIANGLRTDPSHFGEPVFVLPGHGLPVYFAAHSPVVVDFAVDERSHTVYLHAVRLLGKMFS
jgi:hypothetical protein